MLRLLQLTSKKPFCLLPLNDDKIFFFLKNQGLQYSGSLTVNVNLLIFSKLTSEFKFKFFVELTEQPHNIYHDEEIAAIRNFLTS